MKSIANESTVGNIVEVQLSIAREILFLLLKAPLGEWSKTYGSVPKRGQWENTESVTLQKRFITIMISSFWRSHAVC